MRAWTILLALIAGSLYAAGQANATLITFESQVATANAVAPVVPPAPPTSTGFTTVRPGTYSSANPLVVTVAGITVTITRQNGKTFDIVNNDLITQVGKSEAFGSRSLDPFSQPSVDGFIFSFSDDIRAFSLLAGDFGIDPDGLILQAFYGQNLTGGAVPGGQYIDALPATPQRVWTENRFFTAVSDPNAPGFHSVLFYGGAASLSVFIDRIAFYRDPDQVADLIDNPDDFYDSEDLDNPANLGDDTVEVPEPATLALMAIGLAAMVTTRRSRRS